MLFYRKNLEIELDTYAGEKGITHIVVVRSYNKIIMCAKQYENGQMVFKFVPFHYSNTTVRHQGIALSIVRFGAINGLDLVCAHKYDKPKSIKQIQFLFGYVPAKAWDETLEQIKQIKHVRRVF